MIDDAELEELKEDLKTVQAKQFNISCCRSYMTPRGRCYSCPEDTVREVNVDEEEQ